MHRRPALPHGQQAGDHARFQPVGGDAWRMICLIGLLAVCRSEAAAQLPFEREPINYGQSRTEDAVARLQQRLDAKTVVLEYDRAQGYLPSLLKLLGIDDSSQVLVSSKTSFQMQRISPQRPRAVYFNDESYVGWVQNGDVLEIMSTDPRQGAVFYTLSQDATHEPEFVRDRGQCIVCHASSRTLGVPGGLVRSTFIDPAGQPHYGAGTFTTDHSSPFSERWGGWYVTGTHGSLRHMGNVVSADRSDPEKIDREAGANVTDLSGRFDVGPYRTRHSDIVALMVLEHQTQMHNHLTLASFETRLAEHYDQVMNAALQRPADYVSDSTRRRVRVVGEKLLRYLLFADEFPLTSPVRGTSEFATWFVSRGPRDSQGRSLRDLDLRTRLLKYPCSHTIYSPAFDQLPESVRDYVLSRLRAVLTAEEGGHEFAHLSPEDRRSIWEILNATRPGLWDG
jgi:hypothetical protein